MTKASEVNVFSVFFDGDVNDLCIPDLMQFVQEHESNIATLKVNMLSDNVGHRISMICALIIHPDLLQGQLAKAQTDADTKNPKTESQVEALTTALEEAHQAVAEMKVSVFSY